MVTSGSESGLGIRVKGQCVEGQPERKNKMTEAESSQHLGMTGGGGGGGGGEIAGEDGTAVASISQEESLQEGGPWGPRGSLK